MIKSLSALTNKIVEIETSNNLFGWQIQGVHIWEILRYQVYTAAIHSNFENQAVTAQSYTTKFSGMFAKIGYKISKNWNALLYHPFFDSKPCDVMVFESSRKLIFAGQYIDPYTEFTCREFLSNGTSIIKYQSSFAFDRLAKRDQLTKSIDLISLISGFRIKFSKIVFTGEEQSRIVEISGILNEALNLDIDLLALIKKEILSFKSLFRFYSSLLKSKQPKEIYLVNFCDKAALIAAAKQEGIRVTDIQHGLISSDDIIYNYPNVKEGSLNYFPDRFFAWSEIWPKVSKIPLPGSQIINYGNKYLDRQKEQYSHVAKNPLQVIIISQPGFTTLIAAEVIRLLDHFSGYQVIYKLHPAEYESAYRFKEIIKLREQNNFRFAAHGEDLYALLAATPVVVGLGSTVLIEALSFNCKVVLLDLPGVEWMAPFIDDVNVKMFAPADNL